MFIVRIINIKYLLLMILILILMIITPSWAYSLKNEQDLLLSSTDMKELEVYGATSKLKTLVVGSEQNFPPFSTGMSDSTAGGFTVEYWAEVAAEAGLEYTLRVLPFSELLQKFKQGEIDVLINLAISDERRRYADFSLSHVIVRGAAFVREDNTQLQSEADLSGKSVIVLNADLAHDYAIEKGWGKQLILVETVSEGLELLASGKHDAMLLSKLVGMQTIQLLDLNNIKSLESPVNFTQKFAFAVHKGRPELLAKINEAMSVTKTNNVFDSVYERWFGVFNDDSDQEQLKYLFFVSALIIVILFHFVYRYNLERKRADIELKKRQILFETVSVVSPVGIIVIDTNGMIQYVNPILLSMFSIETGSLTGTSSVEFIRLLDDRIDHDHYEDISLLGMTNMSQTIHLKLPTQKILRFSRQSLFKKNIGPAEILFFVDITDETILDRMKSEFLTTAAHELRTPLSSVMGFSELLISREYNSEKTKKIAVSINRQSMRLKKLLDELLDLARIENRAKGVLNLEKCTLEAALTELCDDMSGSNDFHVMILTKPDSWPVLEFDQVKLRQIILNILNNAYKYSRKGSIVNVYTMHRITEEVSEFGVIVEDNGIGMTAEQLTHFGEKFYRVDKSGSTPGTGLGVSLVKELLAMHNGRLEVTSKIGRGTKVTIWLPIVGNI